MIVIRTQGVKDFKSLTTPVFIIEETDTSFVVTREHSNNRETCTILKKDVPDDNRAVYFWSHFGLGLVEANDYDSSRDSSAFYMYKYGCPEGPIIAVARRGDVAVLVCGPTCHAKSDFVIRQVPGPSIKLVDEFIPGFSATARAKKSRAKMELIRQVNPLDSLSALEKQVDLLTMLVLSLARKQPAAEQPAWLDELETVFNDTSSVQEDALEKAVASMGEYKSLLRALQDVYFKAKNG